MEKTKKNSTRKQPVVTSVDLGSHKTTVILATLNSDGCFEIKGFAEHKSMGIESGIVKDILTASEVIKKTINAAESEAGLKAENIYLSISGKFIKSTNANSRLSITDQAEDESGVITEEHVEKVIKTAVEIVLTQEGDKTRKLIHSIPQSFKVDDQPNTHNPVEMSGDILTAHIHTVLADLNCLKNIRRCFELADYKINQIVFSPLAAAEAVLTEDEKNLGCVLIDIGAGTTDIVFYFEKIIILSAVKSTGGNAVTHDISRILQTSNSSAEALKIDYGSAFAPEEGSQEACEEIEVDGIGGRDPKLKSKLLLSEIIHSRTVELMESVYKSISSGNYHKYIDAGIVLTGGTSNLRNINQLTEEVFNMQVRQGIPLTNNIKGKHLEKITKPQYATAIGLLYYAKKYLKIPDTVAEHESEAVNKVRNMFIKIKENLADFF